MYRNESFHSSSSSLNFDVDPRRSNRIVVRREDDAHKDGRRGGLSRQKHGGSGGGSGSGLLGRSARNLMAAVRRSNPEVLRHDHYDHDDDDDDDDDDESTNGDDNRIVHLSIGPTTRRSRVGAGKVSSSSQQSLKNAEFNSISRSTPNLCTCTTTTTAALDYNKKDNNKNNTLPDRRALLLGTKKENYGGVGVGAASKRGGVELLKQASFTSRAGASAAGAAGLSLLRAPSSFTNRNTNNKNGKISRSNRGGGRKRIEITQEETLAILIAQELENFDC